MTLLRGCFCSLGDKNKRYVLATLYKAPTEAECEKSNAEDILHETMTFIRKVHTRYEQKNKWVESSTEVYNFETDAWEITNKLDSALDSTDNFLDIYGQEETFSQDDFDDLFDRAKASYARANPPTDTPADPEIS